MEEVFNLLFHFDLTHKEIYSFCAQAFGLGMVTKVVRYNHRTFVLRVAHADFKIHGRGGTYCKGIGQGGPVKLDSMWQHRLTRPLHVQHNVQHKIHLTLFQEGFNVEPRRIFG